MEEGMNGEMESLWLLLRMMGFDASALPSVCPKMLKLIYFKLRIKSTDRFIDSSRGEGPESDWRLKSEDLRLA